MKAQTALISREETSEGAGEKKKKQMKRESAKVHTLSLSEILSHWGYF